MLARPMVFFRFSYFHFCFAWIKYCIGEAWSYGMRHFFPISFFFNGMFRRYGQRSAGTFFSFSNYWNSTFLEFKYTKLMRNVKWHIFFSFSLFWMHSFETLQNKNSHVHSVIASNGWKSQNALRYFFLLKFTKPKKKNYDEMEHFV